MEEKQPAQESIEIEDLQKLSSEEMKRLVMLGRALSDPTRIRILGLLGERPMYGQELAKLLDVKPPTISHHLSPLIMAGLVRVHRENNYHYYELDSEGIDDLAQSTQQIARLVFASKPLPPKQEERARVVASFIKDGRLVSIPSQYKKQRYVMEELARSFEWGRLYEEKEVNAILRQFNEDYASLRRYMIDMGIMMREAGRYWLVRPHDETIEQS